MELSEVFARLACLCLGVVNMAWCAGYARSVVYASTDESAGYARTVNLCLGVVSTAECVGYARSVMDQVHLSTEKSVCMNVRMTVAFKVYSVR